MEEMLNFFMKTAIITTGGLATRLLTYTKVSPKAMMPLFDKNYDRFDTPLVKPLIQMIFENLYDSGFRRFCFIVGTKSRNAVKNHLDPDKKFIDLLKSRSFTVDKRFISHLDQLYKKINNCEIEWISQPTPMGFGHALLSAQKFIKNEKFLLHAGDVYFPNYSFLKQLVDHNKKTSSDSTLLLQKKKQLKGYGIAQVSNTNENLVFNVEEKPNTPKSNLVILPAYIFNKKIFSALKKTSKGYNNELQLTDAIKTQINDGDKISSCSFSKKIWFDIGTPKNYYLASNYSYKQANLE